MAKSIYRYDILTGNGVVKLPGDSDFLHVAYKDNTLCVWTLIDTDKPVHAYTFKFYGTGWTLPDEPGRYIGTVVTTDGSVVWHVFVTA